MREPGVLTLRLPQLEPRLPHLQRLHRPSLLPRHPRCLWIHLSGFAAFMANTIGAAESVLRVAATGHDKRLFIKVVVILYFLSALGRLASGTTVAYAGLCFFCLYLLFQSSQIINSSSPQFIRRRDSTGAQESIQ